MRQAIVVTSIFGITDAVDAFIRLDGWDVYYVADEKTPEVPNQFIEAQDDLHFISVDDQKQFPRFSTTHTTEFNEFQRKNIGYLHAINDGADIIADVDDDNMPYDGWELWGEGNEITQILSPKFPNIYDTYRRPLPGNPPVWPRGMPLDEVQNPEHITYTNDFEEPDIAVMQGLVDGDPDVDAIHRLTVDEEYDFDDNGVNVLDDGVWSAFNAQNTLWRDIEAFPYMYLPNTVTMRVTDILRSYVAQYGFWAMDKKLAFNDATVEQDRNPHDLMVDFEDEQANYLDVKGWVETLEGVELSGDPFEDIQKMYIALINDGYVDSDELEYLNAWIGDLS